MSTPNEIRIRKNRQAWRGHGWTATPNALLLRSDISWEAKGAFGWMSLAADDPEFEVTARSLADAGPKGRDHAQKLVRELEQHGYLTRQRIPDPDGTPVLHYELHPIPVDDEHNTYTPSTASARRGAFSQRNPEKLNVQAPADDQGTVDNSERPESIAEEPPEEGRSVFPAQPRKTERAGPARSGPARSGVLTSPSRKTSSSLGSSMTDAEVAGSEEEDEQGEESEQREQARALLTEHARFKPGKFLGDEARVECERLVAQHLTAGWSGQQLGRYLRDWSAQAFNPSTWLPRQLRELGAPPAARRQPKQATAAEASQQSAPASDEARAAARALYPDNRPAGAATSSQPRWKQRLESTQSTDRDPERALADLDDLLGGHSSTA